MSDGRILEAIEKLMTDYEDKEIRDAEKVSKIHRVTFTTHETTAGFLNGTFGALEKIFKNDPLYKQAFSTYNSKQIWSAILRSIFHEFTKGGNLGTTGLTLVTDSPIKDFSTFKGAAKSQVYVIPNSSAERFTIEIRLPSPGRTISTFCSAFRKHAWKKWCDGAKAHLRSAGFNAADQTAMDTPEAHEQISYKTNYAHDPDSTIGLARIDILLEEMKDNMDIELEMMFFQETIDLPSEILRLARIGVKATPHYENGILVGETRIVTGVMKQQFKKETSDFQQIRKRTLDSLPAYFKKHKKAIEFTDPETGLDSKGSRTYRQDAAASNARRTPDQIKKSFRKAGIKGKMTVTKVPLRKRKERDVEYIHRPKNRGSVKKGSMKLSAAIWEIKPEKEKGTGNKLSELQRLKKQINKRLPAEVRRNMGRPALINQTGRFSNSTQLLSLRETAGGISGEYTYQRNPYETFENTGSRKWPVGYNPKPLIAKSIRQLALQYTEQKLTSLRRT
jgi:hypothetical protein